MNKQKALQAKVDIFLKRIDSLTYEQFLSEVALCLPKEHHRLQKASLPKIFGHAVDLRLLFSLVVRNGGYHEICSLGKWTTIANCFPIPCSCTHTEHQLRVIYLIYLLPYQERHADALGISVVNEVEFLLCDSEEYSNMSSGSIAPSSNLKRSYVDGVYTESFRQGFSHIQPWSSVDDLRLRQSRELGPEDKVVFSQAKGASSLGLSVDLKSFAECHHLCLSLLSGLPNEVDYALNTLLLMSQSTPERIRLGWSGPLLELLLCSVGILESDSMVDQCLLTDWRQQNTKKFSEFWKFCTHRSEGELFLEANVFKNSEILFLPPVKECTEESIIEDFSSFYEDHVMARKSSDSGLLSKESFRQEYQHVYTVATILSNITIPAINATTMSHALWSTHSWQSSSRSNSIYISQSTAALRFLFLLAHCKYSTLQKLGLELICNLHCPVMDSDMVLSVGQSSQLMHLSMRLICTMLMNGDRHSRIRGLEMITTLVAIGENYHAFSDPNLFPTPALQAMLDCLLLNDIRLLLAALDALLALTNVVMDISVRFPNLANVIHFLICLLTKSETEFPYYASKGIKISSMQLPLPVTSVHSNSLSKTPIGMVFHEHHKDKQQHSDIFPTSSYSSTAPGPFVSLSQSRDGKLPFNFYPFQHNNLRRPSLMQNSSFPQISPITATRPPSNPRAWSSSASPGLAQSQPFSSTRPLVPQSHMPMLTRVPQPVPLHQIQPICHMQPIRRHENPQSPESTDIHSQSAHSSASSNSHQHITAYTQHTIQPSESNVSDSLKACAKEREGGIVVSVVDAGSLSNSHHIPSTKENFSNGKTGAVTDFNSSPSDCPSKSDVSPPKREPSSIYINGSSESKPNNPNDSHCNIPVVLPNGDNDVTMNGTDVLQNDKQLSSPPSSPTISVPVEMTSPPFLNKDQQVMPPPLSPAARLPQLRRFAHNWLRENYEIKLEKEVTKGNGDLSFYGTSRRSLQQQLHAALNQGRIHMGGPHVSELAPPSAKLVDAFLMEVFPDVQTNVKEADGLKDLIYLGVQPRQTEANGKNALCLKSSFQKDKLGASKHKSHQIHCADETHGKRICIPHSKPLNGIRVSPAVDVNNCGFSIGGKTDNGRVETNVEMKTIHKSENGLSNSVEKLNCSSTNEMNSLCIVSSISKTHVSNGILPSLLTNEVSQGSKCTNSIATTISISEGKSNVKEEFVMKKAGDYGICNGENHQDHESVSKEVTITQGYNELIKSNTESNELDSPASDSILSVTQPIIDSSISSSTSFTSITKQLPYICRWSLCYGADFSTIPELNHHVYHHHILPLMDQRQWSSCQWRKDFSLPHHTCEIVRGPLSLYQHLLSFHINLLLHQGEVRDFPMQNSSHPHQPFPSRTSAPLINPPFPPSQTIPPSSNHLSLINGYEDLIEDFPEYPLTKHMRLTAALCLRNLSDQIAFASEFLKHESLLVEVAFSSHDCSKVIAECLQRAYQSRSHLAYFNT